MSLAPYKVEDEDLDQLRQAGLKDEDILLATHIIGIFNYLVRLADVFGLELEPEVLEGS